MRIPCGLESNFRSSTQVGFSSSWGWKAENRFCILPKCLQWSLLNLEAGSDETIVSLPPGFRHRESLSHFLVLVFLGTEKKSNPMEAIKIWREEGGYVIWGTIIEKDTSIAVKWPSLHTYRERKWKWLLYFTLMQEIRNCQVASFILKQGKTEIVVAMLGKGGIYWKDQRLLIHPHKTARNIPLT